MADFFRIESQQTLHVVELTLPELIDPLEFDRLNDAMLAELDGRADQRWVLDLGRVHYMGSAMLGLMVNIRQRIKAGGGKLVLCGMSPRLLNGAAVHDRAHAPRRAAAHRGAVVAGAVDAAFDAASSSFRRMIG